MLELLRSSLLDLLGTWSPVAERNVRFDCLDIAPITLLATTSAPVIVYSRNGSITSNTRPSLYVAMKLWMIPAGHGRIPVRFPCAARLGTLRNNLLSRSY